MLMHRTSFARTERPLTEIEFCSWVAQALPRDRLEYHRGFLALDRARSEIDRLAARALWAYEQELVHLVQRRAGADGYAYVAVARRKPRMRQAAQQIVEGAAQ